MNSDTQVVVLEGKDSGTGVKLARAVQADGGARAYVLQACRAASLQAGPVALARAETGNALAAPWCSCALLCWHHRVRSHMCQVWGAVGKALLPALQHDTCRHWCMLQGGFGAWKAAGLPVRFTGVDYETTPQEALRDRAENAQTTAKAVVRSLRCTAHACLLQAGCWYQTSICQTLTAAFAEQIRGAIDAGSRSLPCISCHSHVQRTIIMTEKQLTPSPTPCTSSDRL